MTLKNAGILRFEETCMPRPWGGHRLAQIYGKPLPANDKTGEIWLVSDHPACESVIAQGPLQGRSLRQLMLEDPECLLGSVARPTAQGRFPLLLKLIDAAENLSVQVHPDDSCATELGEADGGKAEMWYVLDADANGMLFCGFREPPDAAQLETVLRDSEIVARLAAIPARPGDAVLVPAGMVHAVGGGVALAEIQQNSDLTYRIFDWGRTTPDGRPRETHLAKAARATKLNLPPPQPGQSLRAEVDGVEFEYLGACRHFAARRARISGTATLHTHGRSPHILLALTGRIEAAAAAGQTALEPGCAALLPAGAQTGQLHGEGVLLDFFVPDPAHDVLAPLRQAGHTLDCIKRIAGDLL